MTNRDLFKELLVYVRRCGELEARLDEARTREIKLEYELNLARGAIAKLDGTTNKLNQSRAQQIATNHPGDLIGAIKQLRAEMDLPLKEAKEMLDPFFQRRT